MRKLRSAFYSLLITALIGVSPWCSAVVFAAPLASETHERARLVLYALKVHESWMAMALRGAVKNGEQNDLAIAEAVVDLMSLQKEIDKLQAQVQSLRQLGVMPIHREILLESLLFAKHEWQRRLHVFEADSAALKQLKARIQILENDLVHARAAFADVSDSDSGDASAAALQQLDELADKGESILLETQKLLTASPE